MDDLFKLRMNNYNKTQKYTQRSELNKLKLRKNQLDKYFEEKRLKIVESPSKSITNKEALSDLTLIKDINFFEIVNKLKSIINSNENWYKETQILKECIINLRKLTCRNLDKNYQTFLNNKIQILFFNILEYFVTLNELKYEEYEIIYETIWALNNMVCITKSEIFIDISERNFLTTFKNYLFIQFDKIVEMVALCMGNIVVESTIFRDCAINNGILERIVNLVKDTSKPLELTKNCLFVISNILRSKPLTDVDKVIPSLNVIILCLWKTDEEIIKMCLWSLSYASDGPESIQNIIVTSGCASKILEYVVMKKKEIQLPSLRILGNLAASSSQNSDKLMESQVLKTMIDLINMTNEEDILKEILWTLNNFSFGSTKVVNYMINNEKMNKHFKRLILEENDEIIFKTFSIYYNISKNGNFNIQKFIEIGVLELIIHFLIKTEIFETHTCVMAVALFNKIIYIDFSLARNFKIERQIYLLITQIPLKEKFEYILLNAKQKVLSELLERALKSFNMITSKMDEQMTIDF